MFAKNFRIYEKHVDAAVRAAGPKVSIDA